ncbi:MAG: ACT domain-containing protein [Gemmatimonadetes bacterium]|nr:ACT domain-containing protein [Gemmatimonadota bacterium]
MSTPVRIAFQGELGAFSEEAILQLWGSDVEPVPQREFRDVVSALRSGSVDRAILPLENTIVGSVQASHDAIDAHDDLFAIAETVVAVHHCLLGPPGARFEQVTNVFSHPVALAQCGGFFAQHSRLDVHAVYDTAGAALDVSNLADPTFAAVASRNSAERYHLDILKADIEDRHDNQTRFIAFAREPLPLPPLTPARTMLLLTTTDVPGALLQALAPLASHGINMRRIETRPTGNPWSYRFFVEFDHQVGDEDVNAVIGEIADHARAVRVVGTYPRWEAGRRGSIGWKSGDLPPDVSDSASDA